MSSPTDESSAPLSIREEQRLMTRRRIVAAARRVFEDNGDGHEAGAGEAGPRPASGR
jgi:hypothetical protein